jgi:hypothetical protein
VPPGVINIYLSIYIDTLTNTLHSLHFFSFLPTFFIFPKVLYDDYISWILMQVHLFWLLLLFKSHLEVDLNKQGELHLQYRTTIIQHMRMRILLKNIAIIVEVEPSCIQATTLRKL